MKHHVDFPINFRIVVNFTTKKIRCDTNIDAIQSPNERVVGLRIQFEKLAEKGLDGCHNLFTLKK